MNQRPLRILQIVPSVEQEASGPSYSVPQLAAALADRGHEVTLLSVGGKANGVEVRCPHIQFKNAWNRPRALKHLWASGEMRAALPHLAKNADVIHSHGLWSLPNVYPASVLANSGASLVVSPRGTLGRAALQFSKIRKRLFWFALQRRAVRAAAAIHATSVAEYDEIRAFHLTQPVIVAPNGISLPTARPPRMNGSAATLLYLGRIHPKKGLESLIVAWSRVAEQHPGWKLRIIGPGDPRYIEELRGLARANDVQRLTFEGPVYGDEKAEAYQDASLFVMPTLNENFGMTVAEALAYGVPVVCTKGAPWQGLETHRAGWWVDGGTDSIAFALDRAMATAPSKLTDFGIRGRNWMAEEYGWPAIAAQMECAYQWLRFGGDAPATIRLD